MYRILLVEDDANIQELITEYFTGRVANAFCVDVAADGQQGLEMAYENAYDLLLLDVMLPEVDGFEICREVRRESDVPIVFLTARANEADMLSGYALGCDDYLVKPFLLSVLYQKVNALIKRAKGTVRCPVLTAGVLSLNPNNGMVLCDGEEVELTAKEYTVLKILMAHKGGIVSRERLICGVWGYDCEVDGRSLDNHIKNLRKALGVHAGMVKTVFGRGYRLEESE